MKQILLQIYTLIQTKIFLTIDQAGYDNLILSSRVLEQDLWGIKVVETEDHKIVKLFRLKRIYSSALLSPYACRFKKNAERLAKLGIKTVEVEQIVFCPSQQRHLLTYKKIVGVSANHKLSNNKNNIDFICQLIKFVAMLHGNGVYFRSLHFGNIIIDNDDVMALIDISDLKVYPFSLTISRRIRNWKHLLKYEFEKKIINEFGWDAFFSEYAKNAGLSSAQSQKLYVGLDNLNHS